jgi:hypothetical protein
MTHIDLVADDMVGVGRARCDGRSPGRYDTRGAPVNHTITKIAPGLAAIAVVAAGSLLAAPTATAAQGEQPLTCNGQDVVVRTGDNHSSDRGGWGAAQIVEGWSGILIPTSFAFSAYDNTLGQPIFSATEPAGGGHAHGQQETVTCTQETTTSLGDLLEPGDEVPPGAALTDEVTFTLTVVAVHQS